jgi:hypothetical protein
MEITQRLASLETRLSQLEFTFNRKQSSFVTLSGDQNINGEKTFNEVSTFKKGLILQTDMTVISNPTIYLGSNATADTQANIDNSNKLATTAFVQNLIEESGGGGGGATSLNSLSDVTLSSPTPNQILKYNGSIWINSTLSSSNLSDSGDLVKTTDYTASDVLTKLLTVDGDGSGLDADLLDGSHKSSFLLKADNLSDLSSTSTARSNLGLGTASTYNAGTSANNIVQLNGSAQLPAIDGSLLTGITATQVSGISGTYAPLSSPALTGTPTAPTASPGTNTTQIATTAFVQSEAYTDTDAVTAVNSALASGYNLTISGTVNITGTANATTQNQNDNSTKVATTAYVQTELSAMILNDLSDVVITSPPSNNQVLKYDTGTSKWINGSATATVSNLDDIGDVAVTDAIDGDILKYDGSQWVNKKPSIALNYVALTNTSITLASGKYYTYTSATDTTQKNILTLPSNGSLSNTGGETIYVAIVDSVANSNNNYVLKAGTNTQIIYEDVILAEASELSLSTTGLYTITHVKRDGAKIYYVTLNKSVTSSAIAVAKTINLTGAVTGLVSLNNQNSAVTLNTTLGTITNSDLQYDSIYIGSHTLSLGGTLNLSGLTVSGSTLSVNQISLDDLSGVALGTLSTGQVLKYDGNNWVNGTDNSGGGGGGDVYLANANTFTNTNTFNGDLLVESVAGEDKFKVDNGANTIDMFTPATLDDAYIYVKFDDVSWMNDFFYVFTSHDNGITRQVVPLTLIQDSGTHYLQKITSWNMGGTYTFDYSVYSANGFMQYTNPSDVPNASFKRDPNLTYYISSWNRNQMGSPDFGLAVSDSNNGLGLTYVDLAKSGFDPNMVETIYGIVANVPTEDNTLDADVYVYDTRTTSLANFDKVTDITTLTRLEVDTYAVVNKLVVNSTVTLNGTIDLGSSATATTPSANDNTTKVATTAYVQTELSNMVLNDLSDVQTGGLASNQLLKWNGSYWLNGSIASTDLSNTSNIPLLDTSNIFTNDLTIQKNESTPIVTSDVYLYVRYQNFSLGDGEIFYVFSTSDGGATRQVLPFTLMMDSGVNYLQEDNIFAYKRYKPATAVTYNNSSNAPNASIGFEAGTTYYIEGRSTWDDSGTPNDIEVFFSSSSSATPTWSKLFPDDTGSIPSPPLIKTYQIVLESILSPVSLTSATSITDRPSSTGTVSDMIVLNKDTGNIVSNGFIQLKKQTNHPSTVTDHAHVYAKVETTDTEIYVQDSAGNNTRLSSHNEEGEWEYYSFNKKTGKAIRINMEKMIKAVETLTGEKFIIEE